jgi:hypothetical protein
VPRWVAGRSPCCQPPNLLAKRLRLGNLSWARECALESHAGPA